MFDQQNQEFDEIYGSTNEVQQQRIKGIVCNYDLELEHFVNYFEAAKFNTDSDNVKLIIDEVEDRLKQNRQPSSTKRADNQSVGKQKPSAKSAPSDVFKTLTDTKKRSKNSKPMEAEQAFRQRKSRGQFRTTYNDQIHQVQGYYNSQGKAVITVDQCVEQFDFFNQTCASRTNSMQSQFEIIEQILKGQLNMESFSDFGQAPRNECCRIVGRVINTSIEDEKLKPDTIGLLNTSDDGSGSVTRLILNLDEINNFSMFEGEVIVAEGFNGANSKFHVNRLFKPQINKIESQLSVEQFDFTRELYQQKELQVMIAVGPYTTEDCLSYDALKDLLQIVRAEQPHCLILCGPFLDTKNHDIQSGEIVYNQGNETTYMDFDELFQKLMSLVKDSLQGLNTELIVVPSVREINHISPLPQAPYKENLFPQKGQQVHRIGNPQMFYLNDIKVGICNQSIIKDLCLNMVTKFQPGQSVPKIDLALQSIMQQRTFYPLYPPSPEAPIEWEQYQSMMFNEIPDIMVTPSDLMLFAKNINNCVCINPGMIIKDKAAGSYAKLTIQPRQSMQGSRASDRIRVDIINI